MTAAAPATTSTHGPECPMSKPPRGQGGWRSSCACVTCHCADLHIPGGEFGTCQRCLRKRVEDLRP